MRSPWVDAADGKPERSKGLGEHVPLARTNPLSGKRRGDGFSGGIKSLGRRLKAGMVLGKSARAEGVRETCFRPRERRKALKGEAHECWELKKASKGP